MTREEMADLCEDVEGGYMGDVCLAPDDGRAIAAELRKSCASCKHFDRLIEEAGQCRLDRNVYNMPRLVPVDGSGYCRPGWEAK